MPKVPSKVPYWIYDPQWRGYTVIVNSPLEAIYDWLETHNHTGKQLWEWRDNIPMNLTLHVEDLDAKTVTLKDQDSDVIYLMFLKEFAKVIESTTIDWGVFSGTFHFIKRKRCYSLALLLD
jgi:hypothetical protein